MYLCDDGHYEGMKFVRNCPACNLAKKISDQEDEKIRVIIDEFQTKKLEQALAERKAVRRPDKEKLQIYLVAVFGIEAPEMKTPKGKAAWEKIDAELEELNMRLGPIVEAL